MRKINKFEYSQAKAILWFRLFLLILIFVPLLACFELYKQNKQLKSKPPETIIVERDISPIPYDDLGEYTLTFYTHTGNRTAIQIKKSKKNCLIQMEL